MSTLDSAVQHLFKKVLPVLLSGLSYNDLEVQNGTMALEVWGRMVLDDNFDDHKEEVWVK